MCRYPLGAPFPAAIDADFPALPYQSRRGRVKSAVHWGQRKLLLSEVQLLIEALERCGSHTRFHIVYAGSAPGEHLAFLDAMFPGHRWELVDPMPFHAPLARLPNFVLRNMYFTNEAAYGFGARRLREAECPALAVLYRGHYADPDAALDAAEDFAGFRQPEEGANLVDGVAAVAQPPLPPPPVGLQTLFQAAMRRVPQLFVCDIRSGSVTQRDGDDDEEAPAPAGPGAAAGSGQMTPFEKFEHHVADDMAAQQTWVELLQPTYALLKFRLPYMEVQHPITKEVVYRHPTPTTSFLRGDVLLPIWSRPTTTECRLLVREGAFRVEYDNKRYEDQCFFFNTVAREAMHFAHLLGDSAPRESYLDHRFDGAAEVEWLRRYIALGLPALEDATADAPDEAARVLALSGAITAALPKTFPAAAERLDRVRMEKAQQRGFVDAERRLQQRTAAHRDHPVWWENGERPTLADGESPWQGCRQSMV